MKINKILLLIPILCSFIGIKSVFAQVNEEIVEEQIVIPSIVYPYQMEAKDIRTGKIFNVVIENPKLVAERLKSIENIMPMVYNESVQKYLDFFLIKRPQFTQQMMEDKDLYFPIFEKYLEQNSMPEELKYLALLESGLNPKAISRSKAVGLWQFMSFTGKEMGLTINDVVDERMHIEKSTDAACKYLKNMYKMFDDWDLALASYNTGPGRIRRTIRSTGLNNYWDLHPHIHPDTRAYVPQFIALAYLMNFGKLHGISPENKKEFIATEKIPVGGYLDLNVLANLSQIDISEIRSFNPHLKVDVLPDNYRGYEISLPLNRMTVFNQNRIAILDSASKRNMFSPNSNNVNVSSAVLASSGVVSTDDGTIVIGGRRSVVPALVVRDENVESEKPKYTSITENVKKVHVVSRGEFLLKIAKKYDVTSNEIKKWNHKKTSQVNKGERLIVYVSQTRQVKTNSVAAKSTSEVIKGKVHTVRSGDTLWNISQRYNGVTVDDIKRWNNIKGNRVLVGQKIKIKS